MEGLADTLRQQQGLADESFQQLQREFREGMLGQGRQGQDGEGQDGEGQRGQGQQQGQGRPGGQGGQSGEDLAQRQEALRDMLDGLQDGLPGNAGPGTRDALDEAERSMGAARDALREGETSEALDRQAEAIDSLRDGIRGMAEDMRQAQGEGAGGEGDGRSAAEGGQDPLGRPMGTQGGIGTNESMLPDADAAARARGLLDEIRRRSGDLGRPEIELDYLRRLLDRF